MNLLKSIAAAVTLGVILGGSLPAEATLSFTTTGGSIYTGGGSSLGQVIPDNTPAGVGYSISFADTGFTVGDITVSLNLSGGYNGDIYAYLAHGSQISTLINSPVAGLSGSAMNITLIEGTGSPLPTSSSANLTGSYTATTDLATFNSTDPNGAWTIFFADMNPGDTSTLNSFLVTITAVPEPVTMALVIFLGLVALRWWLGKCWTRNTSPEGAEKSEPRKR